MITKRKIVQGVYEVLLDGQTVRFIVKGHVGWNLKEEQLRGFIECYQTLQEAFEAAKQEIGESK